MTKEYKHSITAGLCGILRRAWDAGGGPLHFSELGLTYNAASNMQKLRYFGLLVPAEREKKTGRWLVTWTGQLFLTGKHKISRHAWTRDGQVIEREAPFVSIHDIERAGQYYIRPEEWHARTRELGKNLQTRLKLAV